MKKYPTSTLVAKFIRTATTCALDIGRKKSEPREEQKKPEKNQHKVSSITFFAIPNTKGRKQNSKSHLNLNVNEAGWGGWKLFDYTHDCEKRDFGLSPFYMNPPNLDCTSHSGASERRKAKRFPAEGCESSDLLPAVQHVHEAASISCGSGAFGWQDHYLDPSFNSSFFPFLPSPTVLISKWFS